MRGDRENNTNKTIWSISTLIFALGVLISLSFPLHLVAQDTVFEYSISVRTAATDDAPGVPVTGVQIEGSHGFNDLNGRVTGVHGDYTFDIRDAAGNSSLIFHKAGYRFEPQGISLSECVGRICSITAIPTTESEDVPVRVIVITPDGEGLPGAEVHLSESHSACGTSTDSDGVAFFAVPKRTLSSGCSDTDSNANNNFSTVFVSPPSGGKCTIREITKPHHCITTSGVKEIFVRADCNDALPELTPLPDGEYSVKVVHADGGESLVAMKRFPGDHFHYSNIGGGTFKMSDLGLANDQKIMLIPSGSFQFFPSALVLEPGACPGNRCIIRSKSSFLPQWIGKVTVSSQEGDPISGAQVQTSDSTQCGMKRAFTTDSSGSLSFPYQQRKTCDSSASSTSGRSVSFAPSLNGCSFHHNSLTPFEACPTGANDLTQLTGSCDFSPKDLYKVSGTVLGPDRAPFPRAQIIKGDEVVAISGDDGQFSFTTLRDDSFSLTAKLSGYLFSPESLSVVEVNQDLSNIDFLSLGTTDGSATGRNNVPCEDSDTYTISGVVLDDLGERLEGATILNNHEAVTTTGPDGTYSFSVPANSEAWVTVEYDEEIFDPSGVVEPDVDCHREDFNFQIETEDSYIFSGVVEDEDGNPFTDVELELIENGESYELTTDENGIFMTTVADGATYQIIVTDKNYICTPKSFSGEATGNFTNLDFVCSVDECPDDDTKDTKGSCGCGVPETDSDNDGTADCLDLCPSDSEKINPGACGCGKLDTDSDNDGTADCNDFCSDDPLKSVPGLCGCGVEDSDSDLDGDGVADCNDLCSLDSEKSEPGVCGCGVSDIDSDGDGTPDCNDSCVNDPNKTEPLTCGCGVLETDADGDGTPHCVDLCENDKKKTAPGVCGCGTIDSDRDNDGTLDCEEQCADDPLKLVPGTCGCGTSDIDSDGDGTPDCNDKCEFDTEKIAPGLCGCGVIEDLTDQDGDLVLDCNDLCALDPLKASPGKCGCGVTDKDTDNDKTPDCFDLCPNDKYKTEPGECGCGTLDRDTDKDGILDCFDECPNDKNKTTPGICGCGLLDQDSDGDGVYDCNDSCRFDENKTEPGQCGCGTADIDSDNDGELDCNDECSFDPEKTLEGICGCGVSELDSDLDGTPDCVDFCPLDEEKKIPGQCGCGNSDIDSDGDEIADCVDLCKLDKGKTEPGLCGCGVSDKDTDGDDVPDCEDQCKNDKYKLTPGECGCGVQDIDSDADGTLDCFELCPKDPFKLDPGACGCGIADVDSDGDGVLDCKEECSADPNKNGAGICGCGVPDIDTDGDGVVDCVDKCPNDGNKQSEGQCGCGFSDLDTDFDGVADCRDECPKDFEKLNPGQCGCGVSDKNTDNDGVPDCLDACPFDKYKVSEGICGCGVQDADTDGDGIVDCKDSCPLDPLKSEEGACGCGVLDIDSDGDGTLDCKETCSDDPSKTEPGICGCGVADLDENENGLTDCLEEDLHFGALCFEPQVIDPDPAPSPPGAPTPPTLPPANLCDEGATEVLSYSVGSGANGKPVAENRQNTSHALGVPENIDTMNFVSLGKGGSIELGFGGKALYDGAGYDLQIIETSWGQSGNPCESYPEFAEVFGTSDGTTWKSFGTICRDGGFDIGSVGFEFITAVKIVDRTTVAYSDGYDVDGITCPTTTDPSNPPEPTEPTEPTEPSEPTEPTEPGEPTEPTEPGDGNGKVTLCHRNHGKKGFVTITVGQSAVQAHLNHGDTLGACPGDDGINVDSGTRSLQSRNNSANEDKEYGSGPVKWSVTNPNDAEMVVYMRHVSLPLEQATMYVVPKKSSITIKTEMRIDEQSYILTDSFGEEIGTVTHEMNVCGEAAPGPVVISGELVSGRRGRKLNTRTLKLLEKLDIQVRIYNSETGEDTVKDLYEPYLWSNSVNPGALSVKLIGKGFKVTSRPANIRYYNEGKIDKGGFIHAIRAGNKTRVRRGKRKKRKSRR